MADTLKFAFDRPDGLTPEQRALLAQPLRIAAGYGMRVLSPDERIKRITALADEPAPRDILQVWEPPRSKQHLYVVSVDVSSGMGLDNSVIDVTRAGTIREPDEQVAQFVTNTTDEMDLAAVVDAIGRLYRGRDDQPALAAVECNGLGIATQQALIKTIGYTNLYIWQYIDAVEGHEFTKRYGWYTNPRTRPLILQTYVHAIKSVDPHTGLPDYRINSPWTISELSSFQSPGPLWLAEAVDGAHDDAIMAGAIGVYCARTLAVNERETIHDARRRISEEATRVQAKQSLLNRKIDFQNMDTSADEMNGESNGYGDEPYDPTAHYL